MVKFLWLNSAWMPILRFRIQFHIAALSTIVDSRDYMKQGYTRYIVTIVFWRLLCPHFQLLLCQIQFITDIDISTPFCTHNRGSDFVDHTIEILFSPNRIHKYQQLVVDTVPANKFLFVETVSVNNFLFAETVSVNNFLFAETSLCE